MTSGFCSGSSISPPPSFLYLIFPNNNESMPLPIEPSLFSFSRDFLQNWTFEDRAWLCKRDKAGAWRATCRHIGDGRRGCKQGPVEPVARSRSRRGTRRIRLPRPVPFRWFLEASPVPKGTNPCQRPAYPVAWLRGGNGWWRTRVGTCRLRRWHSCQGKAEKAPKEPNRASCLALLDFLQCTIDFGEGQIKLMGCSW